MGLISKCNTYTPRAIIFYNLLYKKKIRKCSESDIIENKKANDIYGLCYFFLKNSFLAEFNEFEDDFNKLASQQKEVEEHNNNRAMVVTLNELAKCKE